MPPSSGAPVVLAGFESAPSQAAPLRVNGRPVRVGISTQGGPIAIFLPRGALLTDAEQGGRALRVGSATTLRFYVDTPSSVSWNGRTFSGPLVLDTPLGKSGGWRHVLIRVEEGEFARVTSNGKDPRWGRPYRGHLEVFAQRAPEPNHRKGPLAVVNVVGLEDYLKGVLPWEMSPSAPFEALKAQAIAARTKALDQMRSRRFKSGGFDVCDYDACQGYPGTENEKNTTTRAVQVTRGLALFHNNQPIDAVFCTNSGGITANARDVWRGPNPVPYLQSRRDVAPDSPTAQLLKPSMTESDWREFITRPWPSFARPDETARRSLASRRASSARTAALFQENDWPEFYRWERLVAAEDVTRSFAARGFLSVSELRVVERSASGRIARLLVVGQGVAPDGKLENKTLALEGDGAIRAMFSGQLGSTTALPSSMFVVSPQRDGNGVLTGWKIEGAGWGHGVGMCQRGAQNRALLGQNARQILDFYYTDVQIRRIQ